MCTLDLAYQEFMSDNIRKNLSPDSLRYYRENLTRFLIWLDGRKITKTNKLTVDVVNDYTRFLIRSVNNVTSINTYLRAVRRLLNYLTERHYIKPIAVELLKDKGKIKPTFSSDEVDMILQSVRANDDTSVMMLLLLAVGIRSRSLCDLCVQDLECDDGYLIVRRTKNGESQRLPLSCEVVRVLKEYIAIYGRNGLLFTTVRGNKFNRASLGKRINKRLQELGIEKHKSGVHIFRHTFGKIMSMNACPTTVLQKWFGHSDIRITQRYVDIYGNDLKNTMGMLPTSNFAYKNFL